MSRGPLWGHRDFLLLISGQSISEAGTQISALAVPTVAILLLHATPLQVGIVTALEFLPFLVLGLVAGVYADRLRRRPLMIVADLGRLVALVTIPIASAFGALGMGQIYVVALVVGVFNVFFAIAYQSYLPALIPRADLVEGNSKLEVTRSTAQLAGPAVAGVLIQAVGAARAIYVDAASFAISALSIWAIRKPEPDPRPASAEGRAGFLAEMAEGIRIVTGNPTLWKIAGCTGTANLGSNIIGAVELIFFYRHLHLNPGLVGLVLAVGAAGGLLGALLAGPLVAHLGVGRTLLVSALALGIPVLVPLAAFTSPVVFLGLVFFATSLFVAPYNITQVSLRQAITPDRVQGRMNATMRTIVWGTMPIGSIVGGVLGSALGIVPTIVVGGLVAASSVVWILLGPVRIRDQPEPAG